MIDDKSILIIIVLLPVLWASIQNERAKRRIR